jgi:glycosyltransferase involved in cell wall biosynthesis
MERTVSVIMPVYNAAPFLRQAIDSILNQSYNDFELILINDGSTDDSEAIIKQYADPRIRYFHQPNAGVAATLNKGIGLATGKYIWRHDADDISLPAKLETEVRFLESHPDYALCAVQVAFMTENGKPAWSFRQPANEYFGGARYIRVEKAHFSPYSPITHGTVLMKTSVARELQGYRNEFITGEDVDLWLRLIQLHKAAVPGECLSLHRLNKNSATQKHGWKNEFFRNLALHYYDQRQSAGLDDLQAGKKIPVPSPIADPVAGPPAVKGRTFRNDLLLFLLPLHVDAKDWKGVRVIVRYALRDGWRLKRTWRTILFALMGKRLVNTGVKIKRLLNGPSPR